MRRSPIALALSALLVAGCAHALPTGAARAAQGVSARAHRALAASVLTPAQVPASVVASVLPPAQKTADDASRRRKIDFFSLHDAPVGLKLGTGDGAAYVLSFLGTAKTRDDLNIEMRALVAPGQLGFSHNYSGPVTLARATRPALAPSRGQGVSFELITGLPGDGVTDAYAEFMGHLEERLAGQYHARPFSFDDGPIIYAVHEGESVTGYVFTNQGNRLVLGDRKYADVQSVVVVSTECDVAASYTLIGFNPKTTGPDGTIDYRFDTDERFGTLVEFGEL
jgi:hypothetical protein